MDEHEAEEPVHLFHIERPQRPGPLCQFGRKRRHADRGQAQAHALGPADQARAAQGKDRLEAMTGRVSSQITGGSGFSGDSGRLDRMGFPWVAKAPVNR